MARWKLITSHHLNVEGNEWEYKETDRMTGKEVRRRVPVPLLLDIEDPTLWNDSIIRNPRGEILGGAVVVAYKDKAHQPNDYIFSGDPSPDMFPIDAEAEAISAKFHKQWNAIPNEDRSYVQTKIDEVQEERAKMEDASRTMKVEGMGEMMAAMQEMMKQNAALIATLTSVVTKTERRV